MDVLYIWMIHHSSILLIRLIILRGLSSQAPEFFRSPREHRCLRSQHAKVAWSGSQTRKRPRSPSGWPIGNAYRSEAPKETSERILVHPRAGLQIITARRGLTPMSEAEPSGSPVSNLNHTWPKKTPIQVIEPFTIGEPNMIRTMQEFTPTSPAARTISTPLV